MNVFLFDKAIITSDNADKLLFIDLVSSIYANFNLDLEHLSDPAKSIKLILLINL